MNPSIKSRRQFIKTTSSIALGTFVSATFLPGFSKNTTKPVVGIVKIKKDNIEYAVENVIDLLGGLETVAKDKDSIMLKPNLAGESPSFTTKPTVIRALAKLMKKAGKEVFIGEGSAVGSGFNFKDNKLYRTRRQDILDPMQEYVFNTLDYTDLSKAEHVPLINLHADNLIEVSVPDHLAFNKITMHKSLMDIDLLCSVPMMKTHVLATVTLGMKNLIGLYPGKVYCSIRACMHDEAAAAGSPGVSYEILDMVRVNKLGLTVIDGSMAMQGDGPSDGEVIKMDVIIAGTNPLATDMVGAKVMGFDPYEVPTFTTAMKMGMTPHKLEEIEIRGKSIRKVQRAFTRPNLYKWSDISPIYGNEWI